MGQKGLKLAFFWPKIAVFWRIFSLAELGGTPPLNGKNPLKRFDSFPYLLPELMSKVRGVQDESVCGLKNSFGLTWLIVFWSHSFAIGYNLRYDNYIWAYCLIPSWNIVWSEDPTYLTLAITSPTHAVRQSPPLSSMEGWALEVSQILIWLRRPSTLCRVSQKKLITEFLGLS